MDYYNWAPGEPNDYHSTNPNDYKPDGEDCANLDVRRDDGAGNTGTWNDIPCGGEVSQGGNGKLFPICSTSKYRPPTQHTYVGCFVDKPDENPEDPGSISDNGRDMNGLDAMSNGNHYPTRGDINGAYINMGAEASADICAELCAGFAYFATQDGLRPVCCE